MWGVDVLRLAKALGCALVMLAGLVGICRVIRWIFDHDLEVPIVILVTIAFLTLCFYGVLGAFG